MYAHPLLKRAVVAITYKNIFRRNQEQYVKKLESSKGLLDNDMKTLSASGHKALRKLANHAEVYTKNIDSIIKPEVKSESCCRL